MVANHQYDYVIAGGGLQGCLLLTAIQHHQPTASVAVVDRQDQLCGNHTWSFHRTDLSESTWRWFSELVDKLWPGYEVRFGGESQQRSLVYGTILSHQLRDKIERHAKFDRFIGSVAEVTSQRVTIDTGKTITGTAVLDCRGQQRTDLTSPRGGFQKFVGIEVELDRDWSSANPCIMDDDVDQADGFRFIYSLPFTSRRVLFEDTRFSNSAELNQEDCLLTIRNYLRRRGYKQFQILRQESGCLPMPYRRSKIPSPNAVGYRGDFFHAATGFSIPLAANLADRVGASPASESADVIRAFREENRFQHSFSLWLNRMLFQLVSPGRRAGIFKRFYRLPDSSIERFYAHRFVATDAMRLIFGRPPAGLTPVRFLKSFWEKPCPAL
jgi:lycopene beta-cyclase